MPGKNREKDQKMAAELKRTGEERTTQRCPVCYATIGADSIKSKYNHKCGVKGSSV